MSRATGKEQAQKHHERLEALWDDLLSRQPKRIRAAYASLQPAEQQAVLAHLDAMAEEPGWQDEQRLSAQAALSTLKSWAK